MDFQGIVCWIISLVMFLLKLNISVGLRRIYWKITRRKHQPKSGTVGCWPFGAAQQTLGQTARKTAQDGKKESMRCHHLRLETRN